MTCHVHAERSLQARRVARLADVMTNPTFSRLFSAQVVALVGTGLLTVALGLLAYDLAGSAAGAVLGTALAIKMVAYVVVSPMVSAIAHRFSTRGLLVGSNVVRGSIAVLLPFVSQTWQIYVLIFALQAASATFTPVFQAVLPAVLVDEEQYTRGLSLSRIAYDLESLLSPVLAAALLSVMTYNFLFIGTVFGFAASATLVAATAVPNVGAEPGSETFWSRATGGARVMFARPVLRALLALNLVVAAATALVVVNTVVYVHDILRGSNTAVAVLLACYGGGSMLAALAVPRLVAVAADRRVMLTGAAVTPVALGATALVLLVEPPPTLGWPALACAWIVLGAATSLINTPSARLLRYQSQTDTRTAVFAAQFALSHACFFVTYALAGWLGAEAGQPVAAAVLAAVAAMALLLAARAWPAPLALSSTHVGARILHAADITAAAARRRVRPAVRGVRGAGHSSLGHPARPRTGRRG